MPKIASERPKPLLFPGKQFEVTTFTNTERGEMVPVSWLFMDLLGAERLAEQRGALIRTVQRGQDTQDRNDTDQA